MFGYMGATLQNIAAPFAAVIAFILTNVLAVATKGKYYGWKSPFSLQKGKNGVWRPLVMSFQSI
ncbi:hypothetical protein [Ammoniphilus sp. CFH 90114]|uniref:hypothetical protein n=1 Tax=Ammoniphilus sp. CFH 90114 TaxID=2493665 RepID=UPI00100DC435|nr:hypothetical protein [Ammoniphilus sp. CFH 90114]RXT13661.1 hypothetical protein EIZ39_05790 [Ammoniphilus sp. CFH 90114]